MKKNIRNDFPIFNVQRNKPFIYLDSASTTQKPQMVIDALSNFYMHHNANVHRGIYQLSESATQLYEDSRAKVARFINAQDPSEIIFTKGTTESINLVAATWANENVKEGDEIVLTELEHHSNLLPWIQLAQKNKAKLNYIPVHADGRLQSEEIKKIITQKTQLVSVIHVSNALGVHIPVQEIIDAAHAHGARVLIDAAQSIAHQPIDVQKMNCDFLAFSGHKVLGPTGIGILYIKKELHEQIPPYQFGGGMVYEADFHHATWRALPQRLEAGTPPIAQAIGLGAAIDYIISNINWHDLRLHESQLCAQLIDGLSTIPSVEILGPIDELKKVGHLVTFKVDGMHPHDVAAYLDNTFGICVRAGHQCAQPLAKKLGIDASVRASFFAYNTSQEVEQLVNAMKMLHQNL